MTPVRQPSSRRLRAFSLLELMVAVGIMGVIVAALYTVFNQTQKALRANVNQTDVLEGGRFAMEQIVGDLRRLSAAGVTAETNFLVSRSPAIQAVPLGELQPADLLRRYYDTNPARRLQRLPAGGAGVERQQRAPHQRPAGALPVRPHRRPHLGRGLPRAQRARRRGDAGAVRVRAQPAPDAARPLSVATLGRTPRTSHSCSTA